MKQIPLTQGKSTLVDDEDFEELSQHKWYANKSNKNWYAKRNCRINGKWIKLRMHRLIMNAQKGQEIDHKNGNGLDNRRCNLRFCTQSQNLQNQQRRYTGISQYKGVSWKKQNKKWQAYIRLNCKPQYIGYFSDEIEAAKAYDTKAKELFGEFACLNFPEEN